MTYPTPTLHAYSQSLPGDRVLWLDEHEQVDIDSLLGLLKKNEATLASYAGKRIAVQFENNLWLARLLVMLDGVCEQILFMPSGISSADKNRFMEDSATEALLTDDERVCKEAEKNGLQGVYWQGSVLTELPGTAGIKTGTTHWVLATSGTTGTPKLVSHTLSSLGRSVIRNVEKGADYRWALLYGLSRFAGLQVFLQSFISGSMLIVPPPEASLTQQLRFLAEKGCNAISATPSMWRKILMSSEADSLQLRQITLGGEIADQKLLSTLAKRYPHARIVHIYASTEAGVGFAVKDGVAGFPLSWLNEPPLGIEIRVRQDGMLLLRTTSCEQYYIGKEGQTVCDDDGFVATGDLVQKLGDRYHFLGRDSGAINVGGNKVIPEEIESVLLELDEIELCHVYGKANPIMGQLVVADVVVQDPSSAKELPTKAMKYCRERLAAYKVPALINLVQDLNTTSTGKLLRK